MADRKPISKEVAAQVLLASRRRCCICYGLDRDLKVKQGQLAHLNRDPSDSSADNLAFMCLEHHDWFDSTTSQSKGPTVEEARHFREELYKELRRRDEVEAGVPGAVVVVSEPLAEKPFQPIFADDDRLSLRWIVRAPVRRWVELNLREVTPQYQRDLLDGPLHADPDCQERLAEYRGYYANSPSVLIPNCPRCNKELFKVPMSVPLEDRYTPIWTVREQALAELQRLHRLGVPIEGPRVVLQSPQYWRKMLAPSVRS